MLVKIIAAILLGGKESYLKLIKIRNKHYILKVEEFKLSNEWVKKAEEVIQKMKERH